MKSAYLIFVIFFTLTHSLFRPEKQCAQNYTYSIGKFLSVEKFYTDAVGSMGD